MKWFDRWHDWLLQENDKNCGRKKVNITQSVWGLPYPCLVTVFFSPLGWLFFIVFFCVYSLLKICGHIQFYFFPPMIMSFSTFINEKKSSPFVCIRKLSFTIYHVKQCYPFGGINWRVAPHPQDIENAVNVWKEFLFKRLTSKFIIYVK